MTVAQALAIVESVAALAKEAPQLEAAIVEIFQDIRGGKDASPAVKRAQVLAAEHFLGI